MDSYRYAIRGLLYLHRQGEYCESYWDMIELSLMYSETVMSVTVRNALALTLSLSFSLFLSISLSTLPDHLAFPVGKMPLCACVFYLCSQVFMFTYVKVLA